MTGTSEKVLLVLVLAGMAYGLGPLSWQFFLSFAVVTVAIEYGCHRWRNRTWRVRVERVSR